MIECTLTVVPDRLPPPDGALINMMQEAIVDALGKNIGIHITVEELEPRPVIVG